MNDLNDLMVIPREEILLRLATKIERHRSHLQIAEMLVKVMAKRDPKDPPLPSEAKSLTDEIPQMRQHMIELNSLMHWLRKVRD